MSLTVRLQQDVHSTRRIIRDGSIYDEGFIWKQGPDWKVSCSCYLGNRLSFLTLTRKKPWGLSYQAIVPQSSQCSNLFVPTSPSSSHLGFSLLRIEHTFMTMGQVSAFAADIAIKTGAQSSEEVNYDLLREQLNNAGFLLDANADDLPDRVSNS